LFIGIDSDNGDSCVDVADTSTAAVLDGRKIGK
jgi:hypothetical protein